MAGTPKDHAGEIMTDRQVLDEQNAYFWTLGGAKCIARCHRCWDVVGHFFLGACLANDKRITALSWQQSLSSKHPSVGLIDET
jgi:hypothetical protein